MLALLLPLAALLAGCGGSSAGNGAAAADPPSVLDSAARKVDFAEVRAAVDGLYRAHPEIATFTVQDVAYNETTRDKVLDVCRRGGAESDAASQESVRIAGCAPLIFFFWEYGRERSVPEAVEVARTLYRYALTSIRGPFDPETALSGLLRGWGVA